MGFIISSLQLTQYYIEEIKLKLGNLELKTNKDYGDVVEERFDGGSGIL